MQEAKRLAPLIENAWVRDFLKAAANLPRITPRTLFFDDSRTHYYSDVEVRVLAADEKAKLKSRILDEEFYYNTRYGTPLAYARPLDLLASEGFRPGQKRILDFGYGGIGQLRLLASLGADVVGVEVDPLVKTLYGWPGDQGKIPGWKGDGGRLRLVHGHFPGDDPVRQMVGGGYDLVISKNVLKRGYIHPGEPVPDRQKIDLGVGDGVFVKALYDMLVPGGQVILYNICPAPAAPGKPYIPWADGHNPFLRAVWESEGFRVIAYDRDDSAAARAMAHALGWDTGEQPMDLEKDLFAWYTLVERPATR